jgi:hypothetical protein
MMRIRRARDCASGDSGRSGCCVLARVGTLLMLSLACAAVSRPAWGATITSSNVCGVSSTYGSSPQQSASDSEVSSCSASVPWALATGSTSADGYTLSATTSGHAALWPAIGSSMSTAVATITEQVEIVAFGSGPGLLELSATISPSLLYFGGWFDDADHDSASVDGATISNNGDVGCPSGNSGYVCYIPITLGVPLDLTFTVTAYGGATYDNDYYDNSISATISFVGSNGPVAFSDPPTSVPEPGTLGAVGLGALMVGVWRLRRMARAKCAHVDGAQ